MEAAPPPDPRVYPTREDSELLLPFARVGRGTWFLEVGCGSGAAVLAAARAGARAVATDLNPHALRSVRTHARAAGVSVGLVRTDLAAGLRRFDRILANPPYLPTSPAARDPDPWVNLALDGGPDGLETTRRLFASLGDHLRPHGSAFVILSTRQPSQGRAGLLATWETREGPVERVAERSLGDERLEVWELRRRDPAASLPR